MSYSFLLGKIYHLTNTDKTNNCWNKRTHLFSFKSPIMNLIAPVLAKPLINDCHWLDIKYLSSNLLKIKGKLWIFSNVNLLNYSEVWESILGLLLNYIFLQIDIIFIFKLSIWIFWIYLYVFSIIALNFVCFWRILEGGRLWLEY